MILRFSETLSRLKDHELAEINQTISPLDDMFDNGMDQYLSVGKSAVHIIAKAMCTTGFTTPQTVLDLPCGYGRVLRHLKAFLPDSEFTACDLTKEAVDFCTSTFDVKGIYSKPDFDDLNFDTAFDLIWCGSLLTHLTEEQFSAALRMFSRNLSSNGMAIITLHGEFARAVQKNHHEMISPEKFSTIEQGYLDRGFGFTEYETGCGYGVNMSSPSYALERVQQIPDLYICSYSERDWVGFHDVLIVTKNLNKW